VQFLLPFDVLQTAFDEIIHCDQPQLTLPPGWPN
jgi:hypothetical protein